MEYTGLGIQQLYMILAQILLMGTDTVGIEEPEAHLYERGAALDLRHLLKRMVDEKIIQQLFVATHSDIFDLNPKEYWDISYREGEGTIATRSHRLADIDLKHVYQPGPARHILLDMLNDFPPDTIVFSAPDGTTVDAQTMIHYLIDEGPPRNPGETMSLVEQYLRDVHWIAVRTVQALAQLKSK